MTHSSAILSKETEPFTGVPLYRYELRRVWGKRGKRMVYIMLNPSTADATQDDPTIRRCRYFAEREGCAGMVVVNLFAYRSREPRALNFARDPVGPKNDYFITRAVKEANEKDAPIVLAWGDSVVKYGLQKHAHHVLSYSGLEDALCFGITKKGQPKHPLYLANDTDFQFYKQKVRNYASD